MKDIPTLKNTLDALVLRPLPYLSGCCNLLDVELTFYWTGSGEGGMGLEGAVFSV